MITCALQGGLANSAIQIASIYALALKNNAECKFSLESEVPLQGHVSTKYANTIFKNVPQLTEPYDFKQYYYEPQFTYHELPFIEDCVYRGYFQSFKYWQGHEKEIKSLFNVEPVFEYDHNWTSIHVRRGDYKKNPNIFPLCDIDYYERAMAEIGGDFIVISDDIIAARDLFKGKNVLFSPFTDEVDDFRLMTHCKNNIIANSSFSFLAAWLNPNKDKKVIRPVQWFGSEGPDSKDITPEEWIKL